MAFELYKIGQMNLVFPFTQLVLTVSSSNVAPMFVDIKIMPKYNNQAVCLKYLRIMALNNLKFA